MESPASGGSKKRMGAVPDRLSFGQRTSSYGCWFATIGLCPCTFTPFSMPGAAAPKARTKYNRLPSFPARRDLFKLCPGRAHCSLTKPPGSSKVEASTQTTEYARLLSRVGGGTSPMIPGNRQAHKRAGTVLNLAGTCMFLRDERGQFFNYVPFSIRRKAFLIAFLNY